MFDLVSNEYPGILRQCPLFAGVSAAGLESIAAVPNFHAHKPGEVIVSRRDKSSDVFVLLSGIACVVIYSANGRSVRFGRIPSGSLFGEFSAIDGQPRSATVEALHATLVLRITAEQFWQLMASEPGFVRQVVTHLAATSRRLTQRVYEFSTLAVNNRIHAELLRLVSQADGKAIVPLPTHAEIAERISTHREAVARELSRLAELGIIERQGHALVVRDLAQLERMVHEATGD